MKSYILLNHFEIELWTEWCRNKPESAAVEILSLRNRLEDKHKQEESHRMQEMLNARSK